jgi:hypothetical protein
MSDIVNYEPVLRLQAMDGGPLRGGESYQFGFYDAGVMREIIDNFGGSYKVYTLPIPQNSEEFNYVQELVNDPKVQYALVDKNKIVFVIIENSHGWMTAINDLGYEVSSGDKSNKRLKSLHRPTLLNAHFNKDEINVLYVDSTDYSRYDYENDDSISKRFRDPAITERLLDGGFVISKRLVQRAVANLPVFEPDKSTDPDDYYFDPRVRQQLVNDLLDSSVFNARIIFEDGFLKGNCIAVDLPDDVDVITSRTNIKSEIRYTKGFRFLAEPQGPKSRVITDDQTVINFPKLFRKADMEMWLTEEYKKMYSHAINGELLTNWRYIYQRIWQDNRDINDNEARARMAYVGYRWTAAGFSVTNSPWLFETVAVSHAAPLKHRIPIPCSVYEQIVPESLVRMAGYDVEVEEGTIIRINELGLHVVNDLDWLEMYESHGGHDQDDFFKLFYREMEGGDYDEEKVVIAIRSPNGYGEYSIFRHVEGEWNPAWHKADGTEIRFPKVNGNRWPKRLSDAIFAKEVKYDGLPSDKMAKVKRNGPYTQADVMRDITIAMAGGNVGGFVNACMAHASALGKHRTTQLCSLETAIDKCINPDDADDVVAIDNEARNMIREIIESGKPVDETVLLKRIPKRYIKNGETIVTYKGKVTQIQELCTLHHDAYVRKIREWSQANARPDEIVHELGKRMYYRTLAHLREFRRGLFNSNSSDEAMLAGGIERNNWESMYQGIVDLIKSYDRFQDQYDFVLGLYSASIKNPTSAGKVTDQIVMNRFVFPYLEAALQYYGVGNITMYDNRSGKMKIATMRNTEWFWPDSQGNLQRYDNPVEFQQAHAKDSPVIWTMPKPDNQRLTQSMF